MISVIVPIFNTEKHLNKFLKSIKKQRFTDYEVIMIDDGSTDKSADICKEYAKGDSRFHYYYKENGGSSSARNLGIKKAAGDYIAFVDSDDSIDEDYLESLARYCGDGYDIIQCGMRLVRNGVTTELVPDEAEYKDLDFIKLVLRREYPIFLLQTTVTKLYKRELLINFNLKFDESITNSEDCLFNTQLLPFVRNVKTIKGAKYTYIQDNSFLSVQELSYEKVWQSIRVGILTADIRNSIIKNYKLEKDDKIIKGFQMAVCIIYISNAHEIETGRFSDKNKQCLYDSFFSVMDYPIDLAIDDFEGTDKRIAVCCAQKNCKAISRIYRLRKIKGKVTGLIRG